MMIKRLIEDQCCEEGMEMFIQKIHEDEYDFPGDSHDSHHR